MENLFDSANAPTNEPTEIQSGDFTQWKRTDLGEVYANDSFTLKYSARLEASSAVEIEVTATASGSDYLVQLDSSTTGSFVTGVYLWQAYIVRDSDSERVKVDEGYWEVIADRDTDTTDPRSFEQKALDNIKALFEGRLTKDVSSFSIAGRQITKMDTAELTRLLEYFEARVAMERSKLNAKMGKKNPFTIKARF